MKILINKNWKKYVFVFFATCAVFTAGWYFSIFIVTNQRLRQITQKGFFNRSVIDLGLSKIQNISYNVPGLSASMFGFGTLVIQTYVGDLYLDKIEHPAKIYNDITNVIKQHGNNELSNEKDVE